MEKQRIPMSLPAHPTLKGLRKMAREIVAAHNRRESSSSVFLRRLRRFQHLCDEEFFAISPTTAEAELALAGQYGFADWSDLSSHVLNLQLSVASEEEAPSDDEVLAYYLREDVSQALWELSCRRPLRFFYSADGDIRERRTPTEQTTLHCLSEPAEFRRIVERSLHSKATNSHRFFPFFGITQKPAVEFGKEDKPIGWDYRLEFDFDLARSLRALMPLLALMRHFGVPVLSKYSGHRSLHVIIPAEAFPEEMRNHPDQRKWFAVFDRIGRLFCRFVPALDTCAMGLAKSFELTAPYSFHRHNGLLSLPLIPEDIWDFEPAQAQVSSFGGVTWVSGDFDSDGQAMARLLRTCEDIEAAPQKAIEMAEQVFDNTWKPFVSSSALCAFELKPVETTLYVGLPAVGWFTRQPGVDDETKKRVHLVLSRTECAECKTPKIRNVLGGPPRECHPSFASARETIARSLTVWARLGLPAFVRHLGDVARTTDQEPSVNRAVRLLSLAPEPEAEVFAALREQWVWPPKADRGALFCALALAELVEFRLETLQMFERAGLWAEALKEGLRKAGAWHVEQRPDLALSVLALLHGLDRIRSLGESLPAKDSRALFEPVFGPLEIAKKGKENHHLRKVRQAFKLLDRAVTQGIKR